MRWPFRRRERGAEPEVPVRPEPRRPHREWAGMAPLAPVGLRPEPEVASPLRFQSRLATRWQQPPILAPLGHELTLTAPAGLTSGVVAPVQGYADAPALRLPVASEAQLMEAPMPTVRAVKPLQTFSQDVRQEGTAASVTSPPPPPALSEPARPRPPSESSHEQAGTETVPPAEPPPALGQPAPSGHRGVEPLPFDPVPPAEPLPSELAPRVRRLGRIGPPLHVDAVPPAVLRAQPPAEEPAASPPGLVAPPPVPPMNVPADGPVDVPASARAPFGVPDWFTPPPAEADPDGPGGARWSAPPPQPNPTPPVPLADAPAPPTPDRSFRPFRTFGVPPLAQPPQEPPPGAPPPDQPPPEPPQPGETPMPARFEVAQIHEAPVPARFDDARPARVDTAGPVLPPLAPTVAAPWPDFERPRAEPAALPHLLEQPWMPPLQEPPQAPTPGPRVPPFEPAYPSPARPLASAHRSLSFLPPAPMSLLPGLAPARSPERPADAISLSPDIAGESGTAGPPPLDADAPWAGYPPPAPHLTAPPDQRDAPATPDLSGLFGTPSFAAPPFGVLSSGVPSLGVPPFGAPPPGLAEARSTVARPRRAGWVGSPLAALEALPEPQPEPAGAPAPQEPPQAPTADEQDLDDPDTEETGERLDGLASELYDRIRDRLRRELLVDRERSLLLTDWR